MSTFINHWHANPPIFVILKKNMGLLCNCLACCGQLVKILITLEINGIFGSNFAYLFILILSSHSGMQNGGEGFPSIIFASQVFF